MTRTGAETAMERIVLAYSGDLESSIAIPWLADRHRAEIITVTMDLGQGKELLEEVRDRSLATGALRAHVVDIRDEFARGYIVRALKAGFLGGAGAPTRAVLRRPLVAQKLVTIAHIEQATAVAHGVAGAHAAHMETTVRSLDPMLTVLAPGDEWAMTAAQQADYARQRGVAVPAAGAFDDRSARARPQADLPDEAASVDIAFERGVPIVINGVAMPLLDLFGSLDIIAGAHGVDRVAALHAAHQALQRSTLDEQAAAFSALVAEQYRRILRDGLWFAPMREALDAYVDKIQERVTGVVRLKLLKGECTVVDCKVIPSAPTFIALTKAH
jgi:argininosuccinate synthase